MFNPELESDCRVNCAMSVLAYTIYWWSALRWLLTGENIYSLVDKNVLNSPGEAVPIETVLMFIREVNIYNETKIVREWAEYGRLTGLQVFKMVMQKKTFFAPSFFLLSFSVFFKFSDLLKGEYYYV